MAKLQKFDWKYKLSFKKAKLKIFKNGLKCLLRLKVDVAGIYFMLRTFNTFLGEDKKTQ